MKNWRRNKWRRIRRKHTQLNDKDFETIKTLLGVGLSSIKIHEITGRSEGTIYYIKKSNSFADYQALVKAIVAKTELRKQTVLNGIVPQAPVVNPESTEVKTETLLEVLKDIHKEMKRLADAWETPLQKKEFLERLTG